MRHYFRQKLIYNDFTRFLKKLCGFAKLYFFLFQPTIVAKKKKQKGCGRGKNPLCAIFFTAAPSFHLSHIILAKCGDKLSIFLGARWLHNELKCREKCKFLSKKWHFFFFGIFNKNFLVLNSGVFCSFLKWQKCIFHN